MVSLTQKEREALLILFKDFTAFYNANSISKILGISHVGAQKILKRLLEEGVLNDQKIGRSIIYKPKLDDDYVCKLIAFLLADEANNFRRWKEEFKKIFKKGRVVMLFGSVLKDYAKARDIDIMVIVKKKDYKEVVKIIEEKQELLPKKIHSIEITSRDLIKNIKNRKDSIIGIVKSAVILYGQNEYVEIIKNVTSS
ncbi:nucleotidyltransferase domain-containing protein [Candidatus Woesearchaeota archaeon]|nr:nucleotidyltransferase domain-containing protein [Candidatus Woesearchaeota archaeon]